MEEASDPILLFDVGRDRCRYANARAHELLGADVEARRASDLLGPAGAHFLRGVRDRALCELSLVGPAGEGIHVEASATRLEDGRVHAILRDLTVRRRLERERREFERKLTETQRLESLGLLAGGIAHDFNNLLMIVGGSADQALRSLPPDSPAAPALARIQTSVGRAGDLTTQLLAFAGRGTLRSEPVAMGPLVHEVVALAASNVSASTQIRAQVPPRLPDVQGDPTGLRQVVLNLILNAGDAVAADGGEVRVSLRIARTDDLVQSRSGWMQAPPAGRWIALEVADDGVGMDEQTQRRAFDPFFSTKAENRGLGLPAVRGIVHSLGGYLRLLSRPGGGTRFTILLPASSEAARDAAPEPAEPVLEEEPPRGGLVLVVDDEEGVRQVLHAMLGDLGFAVAEAASGRAALEIHRALGHTITCTLLDLSMPGWSGAETRRRIHALAPDAPVVLMSGFNDVAAPDEPGEAFLQKPFRRADVARLLDGLPSRALTDG
jgi:signal transduction histidine kinase